MNIDWRMLLAILIAVVLARMYKDRIMKVGQGTSTQVSAEIHSPAEPIVIYANPIQAFIKEHYPNAT